jgi:nucleotide-binding universal stress UspA family protein
MITVVVGMDRAESSECALAWARAYADMSGASIRAESVREPDAESMVVPLTPFPFDDTEVLHDETTGWLSNALESHPNPMPSSLDVLEGGAGADLVAAGAAANHVVVGAGEHRSLRRALLGCVSRHVLGRPRCPVVAPGTDHP